MTLYTGSRKQLDDILAYFPKADWGRVMGGWVVIV